MTKCCGGRESAPPNWARRSTPSFASTWSNGRASRRTAGAPWNGSLKPPGDPARRAGGAHGRATSSMSADSTFFDTNVLVYLFDRNAAAKQRRAQALLADLTPSIVISTQVLQEFYVTVTRKLSPALSPKDAEQQ